MTDQEQNPHLSKLPLELAIIILESLPDFDSLFATIQTCRRLYQCFKGNAKSIIESISSNIYQRAIQLGSQTEPFPYQGSCLIIQQLYSAIHSRHIQRDIVLGLFKYAWNFLFDHGLEELLVPLGAILAWSLELDSRRQDAVSLLEQVMSGQPPFKLSGTKLLKNYGFHRPEKYLERRATSVPFDFLRLRLYQQAEMPDGVVSTKEIISSKLQQLLQVPVALITNDGMLFFHDDEMLALQSIIYQPPGSCDESSIMLIRLTNPPRPSRILDRKLLEKAMGEKPKLWKILQELRSGRIERQNED